MRLAVLAVTLKDTEIISLFVPEEKKSKNLDNALLDVAIFGRLFYNLLLKISFSSRSRFICKSPRR